MPVLTGAFARNLGVHRRRDWFLLVALLALSGYFGYAPLYQGWTYLALKTSVKAAPAQLRVARWLRDAMIAGENGHLETAKQWLAAACAK